MQMTFKIFIGLHIKETDVIVQNQCLKSKFSKKLQSTTLKYQFTF